MNINFGIQVYCLSAIKKILNEKCGTNIDNPMLEIDRIVIFKDHLHVEYKGNEYEIQYSELDYEED